MSSRDPRDGDRLPGHGARRGREGARGRGRRQAADALAALDREARAAAAGEDRRRHDRLDGRGRLRRLDDRRAGDPRRPVVRARARDDRRRRRRRPRLAGRERHDDRRDDEDPGRRLHHRLLDARGARLHRALRRHVERQLHGPHRAAARADRRARRSAAARASAPAPSSARRSRSARRRSSARARS